MVGGASAHPGGLQHQRELLAHAVLAYEVIQVLGPERSLDGPFFRFLPGRHQ
jgi:hypothetical protein